LGTIVSDAEQEPEAELEKATSTLDQGLKSCRAVISGYRTLLVGSEPAPEVTVSDENPVPPS